MLNRLRKALQYFAAKAGGEYTIIPVVQDATEVQAAEMLSYYEFVPDLDGIEI